MKDNDNALNEIKLPVIELGIIGWLEENLFSTWYNTILTILGLFIVFYSASVI